LPSSIDYSFGPGCSGVIFSFFSGMCEKFTFFTYFIASFHLQLCSKHLIRPMEQAGMVNVWRYNIAMIAA